ncbi:MAG TPA: hypothetical protein VD929_07580 [Caulobacteraceae bacterium]|nr:hypothetical protein [Caulobacteraceae bacterium]
MYGRTVRRRAAILPVRRQAAGRKRLSSREAVLFALTLIAALALYHRSTGAETPLDMLRHAAAAPDCSAGRAPSPPLDGVACEP